MNTKQIVFTGPGVAQLLDMETRELGQTDVLVKTEYTIISAGTERANLMGMDNTTNVTPTTVHFPRMLGYCGLGRVIRTGAAVRSLTEGDRVVVVWGTHSSYTVLPEGNLIKIEDDALPSLEASMTMIAHMSLGGVRKARVEIGESAMVMGIGILGAFAVQFLRLCGAVPVIAADMNPARRQLALDMGADVALDPGCPDFIDQVKQLTGGKGVNAIIEVSGSARALKQAVGFAARQARVVLLGCTRVSDCPLDWYREVHCTGVTLIGANTWIRPVVDSYPGYWTYPDDCRAVLELLSAGRIHMKGLISEVHSPDEAPQVYRRLAEDREFPIGVAFDWKRLKS